MNKTFRIVMIFIFLFTSFTASAAQTWTGWRDIGVVYTYTAEDTLSVYLKGETCPNTKNYFSINGTIQSNAKQLISMVLTAKASKKQVRILYDPDESTSVCHFKGLQIAE